MMDSLFVLHWQMPTIVVCGSESSLSENHKKSFQRE